MKKKTWGLLLLILVILCGCRKNELEVILSGILINNDEEITESFFLPKYIEGRDDVVINWESSDDKIINIYENEDGNNYKAIVRLKSFAVEMELIATISNATDQFEKSYQVIVAKDDYRMIDVRDIDDRENGDLVKLDVVVIFSEDNLYAVADDTEVIVFKDNHNYHVGDNLIMKLKVNLDSFDIDTTEVISSNNDYYPYRNLELKSIFEVLKIKEEELLVDSLYRVIGEVKMINNQYYLTNPNGNNEFLMLIDGDVGAYEGKLVESLALITSDKYDSIKLGITNLYNDYQYYYQDLEKVEKIIDEINNVFKGIITNDFILPNFEDSPEIEWTMPGYDLSQGKIIHPQIDKQESLEVKVKIEEAIIHKVINISFVSGNLITISEARGVFLEQGSSIVLVEGEVISVEENCVYIGDGKNEITVLGLTGVNVYDKVFIRGEMIDLNTIRLIDYYGE